MMRFLRAKVSVDPNRIKDTLLESSIFGGMTFLSMWYLVNASKHYDENEQKIIAQNVLISHERCEFKLMEYERNQNQPK